MIRITMDSAGTEKMLGRLDVALGDLRPVWPTIHRIVLDFFKARFRSEGAYAGARWVPLSPAYAAWKRRHYGDKPILQLTGRLLASSTEEDHAEHVYRVGPSFMEAGTSWAPSPWVHQRGVPKHNLPARPILVAPSRAEGERIVDAILAFLLRRARGA